MFIVLNIQCNGMSFYWYFIKVLIHAYTTGSVVYNHSASETLIKIQGGGLSAFKCFTR